ncbi:kinetochore-associated protein DSN1 homolog isoform X6 [Canis lupus dingo]|uniref:kinetochore-associated protein DSN1 homolog isoform X6 n=1 Tax=Canis lupus dingo TaxID=286419 RepID=UPI0020C2CA4F|nr:kinetochore-associated protein DSN1 homolog isoform X6 [Canis lupus dingo]
MRVRTREAANCAGVLGWRDFSEAAAEVTAQAAGGAPGLEGAAAVAQDVAARPLAAEGDLRARISGTEAAAGLASRGQEVADLPRDTIRVAPAPVSLASDLSAQPRPVAAPRQPALGDPGRCGLLRGSSSRMSSVIRSEAIEVLEEEPVTSKTYDHPLKSDPIPVEVCSKSPASLEMIQRVSEERIHPGSSPKMGGNCDLIHQEGLQSRSLHLSPQEQSPDRQDKSQSWRRASMKEISRRKSLPAFHQGITAPYMVIFC